ncbi:hypothetical protein FKM82_025336 [Ascaphus truei]
MYRHFTVCVKQEKIAISLVGVYTFSLPLHFERNKRRHIKRCSTKQLWQARTAHASLAALCRPELICTTHFNFIRINRTLSSSKRRLLRTL